MNGDQTVTATFDLERVTLTMVVDGTGSGTTSPVVGGPYTYDYGEVVPIAAFEDTGSDFTGWSTNVVAPGLAATTVIMNGDQTVTATFEADCYTLDVTIVGSGTVDKDLNKTCYPYDEVVTLTPTADSGWTFDGWSGADVLDLVDVGGGDWTITMDADKAVIATFSEAIISPEDSSMTSDPGQNRIRLTLIDQNGNRIPGNTLELEEFDRGDGSGPVMFGAWEVWQDAVERTITGIGYGTQGANWDVEIFVDVLTGNPKPIVKYFGYDPLNPVIITNVK
jgi:hypothetical protein